MRERDFKLSITLKSKRSVVGSLAVFTNEFDFDETIITILDDNGVHEDIQIYLDENEVYIRQWNERKQIYDLIIMSPKMMFEIMEAMKRPKGSYIIR
jgi:hypothetical protein